MIIGTEVNCVMLSLFFMNYILVIYCVIYYSVETVMVNFILFPQLSLLTSDVISLDPRWQAGDGVFKESLEDCQPVHGPITPSPAFH